MARRLQLPSTNDLLETLGYHTVKISWSSVASFWHNTAEWQPDGRTDRRTDGRTPLL